MISIRNKYGYKYLSYDSAKKDWIVDIRLSDLRVKRSFRQKKDAIIFSNKISGYTQKSRPKLPLAMRAKIVELIHSGKTAVEVGIILGCSPSTASKWYARYLGEKSDNGFRFILTLDSKINEIMDSKRTNETDFYISSWDILKPEDGRKIVFKNEPHEYIAPDYDWYIIVALEKADKVKEDRHLLTSSLLLQYRNAIREGYQHQLDPNLENKWAYPRNKNTISGIQSYINRIFKKADSMS